MNGECNRTGHTTRSVELLRSAFGVSQGKLKSQDSSSAFHLRLAVYTATRIQILCKEVRRFLQSTLDPVHKDSVVLNGTDVDAVGGSSCSWVAPEALFVEGSAFV